MAFDFCFHFWLADKPMQLGDGLGSTGIGTTGTIPRQLAMGWIDEQALVVNVAGLGGVIIVGCGHQTVSDLLRRYDEAFSEPFALETATLAPEGSAILLKGSRGARMERFLEPLRNAFAGT